MPDPSGKLTNEERARIERWIADKWWHRGCTLCGHDQWTMSDHVVVSRIGLNIIIGPQPLIAMVQFYCLKCAHCVSFNLAMMGVLESNKTEDQR